MSLILAPAICARAKCTRQVNARGLCKSHYDEVWRTERKARARAMKRLELDGEIPPEGLGILRCLACGGKLSQHSPGQSCRGTTGDDL